MAEDSVPSELRESNRWKACLSEAEEQTKHRERNKTDHNLPEEKLKRIDYILVYPNKSESEVHDQKELKTLKKSIEMRGKFESSLLKEGIEMQKEVIRENVYIKLHTPFQCLCREAEKMKLEMPLLGMELYDDGIPWCWQRFKDKYLKMDDEVDFVSASFLIDKLHVFENHDNPDVMFRPALRCFLTHHILLNIDVRQKGSQQREDDPMAKKGLAYYLLKKFYTDAFILHDETMDDPLEKQEMAEKRAQFGSQFDVQNGEFRSAPQLILCDTRADLNAKWASKFFRYQPLWKIRNYFGEKIAFYYAWSGTLITTLWIPTLLGLGVFGYGLFLSITGMGSNNATNSTTPNNGTLVDNVKQIVENSIDVIKASCDNAATPYFALMICLWGTIFLEVWKRTNATLAYEWDVDTFEDSEPDRPQFYGTKKKPDPIIPGEETWIYPLKRQFLKYLASFSMLIFMVCLVCISAAGVIIYRVIMTIDFCMQLSPLTCLMTTTVVSSVLNAVSILILGKVYDKLAVLLTDWENHRTQTQYDDALILKLFAFQFVNSYTSCFYIAFFRGNVNEEGLLGLDSKYQDTCGTDNNCMAMLSFQVLILMIVKPIPKFLKDIVVPFLRSLWRKRKCCRRKEKVGPENGMDMNDFLERESQKPDPGDLTLGEYTEKVLVYGFLMLFAASFPLAPLIALLVNLIDIRVDAKRLLWMYRRPVATISQDIGMWFGILQFVNVVGVASNAFLIAFTSSWAANFDIYLKLWVVIGFENIVLSVKFLIGALIPDVPDKVVLRMRQHIVFAVKFFIAWIIPDVPHWVKLSMKREKYQVARILEKAAAGHEQPIPLRKSSNAKRPESAKGTDYQQQHWRSLMATYNDNPDGLYNGCLRVQQQVRVDYDEEIGLLPPKLKKPNRKNRTRKLIDEDLAALSDQSSNAERPRPRRMKPLKLTKKSRADPNKNNTTSFLGPQRELSYGEDGETYFGTDQQLSDVRFSPAPKEPLSASLGHAQPLVVVLPEHIDSQKVE